MRFSARLQPQKEVTSGNTLEGERRNSGSLNGPETPRHCIPERPDRERPVLGCPGHEGRRTAGPSPDTPGALVRPARLPVRLGAPSLGVSFICTSDSR